ncbi:hypothetical protein PVAND_005531 [Polypedilum vanderplanki]|uniref:Neurotransmitter-gated ion-channel ligand-binding domain-containing protein n=1 Tax=Polypedilum vanderplanki TaxID=319348 RepID=A0A9J6C1G0_POLVA|nr:hypothetical protein PVAND_005531 [Polypedilum vanderplanki]
MSNNTLLSIYLIISIIKFAVSIDCSVKNEQNIESKIKYKLFCNGYDKTMRPVNDHKTITSVRVKMMIKSYDYDDHYSSMTINTWMINRWNDEFLKWDSREYENIKSIDVRSDLIWRPDFSLYNADISYGIGSCHDSYCLIESNGNISCIEPCSFVSTCRSDYSKWPFDKQNCSMVFGPWMNSQNELDYVNDETTVSKLAAAEHTQWKLVSAKVVKKVISLNSKDKKYTASFPNLSYFFLIERHSSMVFQVIKVAAVTFFILNLTTLFIKTRKPERFIILITNMFLHFQMIHQMSWITPHNGEQTPSVLTFFRNSLVITCILMIETLIVEYLNASEVHPTEKLKNIINYIRRHQMINLILRSNSNNYDDGIVLVEDQMKVKTSVNNEEWTFVANLIDKICLILLFLTYILMAFTLFPLSYIITQNMIKEEA